MLTTDNWCIKVAERVYGPYTTDQLEKFAGQGRLGPRSLIAPAGGKMWRAAKQYPNIADILESGGKTTGNSHAPKPVAGNDNPRDEVAIANFVVVFDVVSGAASRLEHVIRNLGPAFRLTDNVWTVSCDQTVMGVKNHIAPHLQAREPLFVVDSTRGKSIWQNFAPEKQAKMSKVWMAR